MRAQAKDEFVSLEVSSDDESTSASGSESGAESASSSSSRHIAPEANEDDYASDWTDDLTSDAHLNALLVKARIGMDKIAKRASSKSKKQSSKGKDKAAQSEISDEEEEEDADEDRDGELDFMVFEEENEECVRFVINVYIKANQTVSSNIKLPPLLADGLPPLYVEWKDGALSVRNLDAEEALKSLDGPRKTQPVVPKPRPEKAVDSSEVEDDSDDEPAASSSKITLDIAAPPPPVAAYETDSKGRRITKKEKKEVRLTCTPYPIEI